MKTFKKPPTDEEIEKEVYAQTFQETSDQIVCFINGMKYMRNMWLKSIKGQAPLCYPNARGVDAPLVQVSN